ncbi:LysR substrate-binding domain-containing protein [Psychrobium sp. 1_MG-2023]|uniref:LysR substrate-binding domain-containing protein n=1 Tax=Psychrobium sp. 1_MG-2023 TaxID=3062624 RepID=UPI000C34C8F4|nr:LysR substrate-binding domain-containing protein [Psychrobium sp. 1_MG-2023]MDP2562801.1 LysR substrate-binding domain-containing protein [Psychrobium sp. 1_MG-2023]PKF54450.1 LysR family transcriptional regulator [Alteromonadales bacterium alter-6D02]
MLSHIKNINLLRSFESAARNQSYSKAAEELYVSQAAISQQMRQLEATLGLNLFFRQNKNMLLTQQGQTLYDATRQAFGIIQKGINEVMGDDLTGEITITSTQAFTTLWLMPRLNKFSERYPEITVRIMSSPNYDNLKQQHIDLAIRFGTQVVENTEPDYNCEYFGEDPVYPVCSAQLAAALEINQPQDLLQTWLVSLQTPGPYDWPTWFEHVGGIAYQDHQQWTLVHSTDMALNAVLNGHGFTLAARYFCVEQLKSGQLVMPINIPHPNMVKRYLVYNPNSTKSARIKLFMDWLKEEMASTSELC